MTREEYDSLLDYHFQYDDESKIIEAQQYVKELEAKIEESDKNSHKSCNNCKSFPYFCSVGTAIEINELRDLDDFWCGEWKIKEEE